MALEFEYDGRKFKATEDGKVDRSIWLHLPDQCAYLAGDGSLLTEEYLHYREFELSRIAKNIAARHKREMMPELSRLQKFFRKLLKILGI